MVPSLMYRDSYFRVQSVQELKVQTASEMISALVYSLFEDHFEWTCNILGVVGSIICTWLVVIFALKYKTQTSLTIGSSFVYQLWERQFVGIHESKVHYCMTLG